MLVCYSSHEYPKAIGGTPWRTQTVIDVEVDTYGVHFGASPIGTQDVNIMNTIATLLCHSNWDIVQVW